ncbi:MAG: PH domain-containing protein [Candidatus Doudnabacteria bacterium]|nr:PH domain-containing protein [Candidatus Doudnabacteria bacterium]
MSIKAFFPGQQADEKIYLVTRRHWAVLAREILIWLIFVVLLLAYDGYVVPRYPVLNQQPYLQIADFVKTVYLMFLLAGLFTIWILYYLNYQIVTNERIVDVTQRNLLHHTTSELHLGRIQDVTAEVKGIFGNLFDYGNVYVQTAGETARFEFDQVPNPHAVEKLILDLYEKLPAEKKVVQE